MSTITHTRLTMAKFAGIVAATLLAAACASTPETPQGAVQARAELTKLQSDPKLGTLAPEAIREADGAVTAAEQPEGDADEVAHRVYMAQREVETARAVAEGRYAESERGQIIAQRDKARLEARTREVQNLQREIDELHAKDTDRGLVLTLGDVLFATGSADLKPGTVGDLTQLVTFLNKYPERTVTIEGHTDSVGGEDYNLGLSQRRADSVRSYLMQQGIDASRISAKGIGESVPVASNDTAGGRQQNRRVEVIVSNPPMAAK